MPVRVAVVVVVVMMVMSAGVGPGLRVERSLDMVHMPTEPPDHFLDDVIGANAQMLAEDLHRQMPVAEMPCDAHQVAVLVRVDVEQRLGPRDHAHDAAIVQHHAVAVAQPDRLRQVEQQLAPGLGGQQDAAAEPAILVEQHGVNLAAGIPCPGRQNVRGAHQNRK